MATAVLPAPRMLTAGDYLTLERTWEDRAQWLDGVIYAMAGESPNHRRICINLTRLLSTHVRGSPCEVFSKDTKVRSGPARDDSLQGLLSYSDLGVVCGPEQYHDVHQDVLLNPRVLIEVLSPSTQAFDRGEKRERYTTWLETLEDYLLVAQDRPHIEHWHRQEHGTWLVRSIVGCEATLTLESLGAQLPLAEVYERVVFPERET